MLAIAGSVLWPVLATALVPQSLSEGVKVLQQALTFSQLSLKHMWISWTIGPGLKYIL